MTNVFSNLTNVVARMTFGAGDGDAPALLLNSHFDSPLESDGAMDARGPVATIVEVARALLNSDDGTLRAMHARFVDALRRILSVGLQQCRSDLSAQWRRGNFANGQSW